MKTLLDVDGSNETTRQGYDVSVDGRKIHQVMSPGGDDVLQEMMVWMSIEIRVSEECGIDFYSGNAW